jgi:hypothetical protein
MSSRSLHPREEPYRWAIEKIGEAFGQEQVRVTPRNHYHMIKIAVFTPEGRSEDLVLRDPLTDLNKRKDREIFLQGWIAKTRKSLATTKHSTATKRSSAA